MSKTTFTIPGKPRGKQRPRFTSNRHPYTPSETKEYEKLVGMCYQAAGGQMMEGLIAVDIVAQFAPPKSLSKAKKLELLATKYVGKKPDGDNIAKIILDGLQGVAMADDALVAHLTVTKIYGETDQVTVTVEGGGIKL